MARSNSATSSGERCGSASIAAITANGLPTSEGKGVTPTNVPSGRATPFWKTTFPFLTRPCSVIASPRFLIGNAVGALAPTRFYPAHGGDMPRIDDLKRAIFVHADVVSRSRDHQFIG